MRIALSSYLTAKPDPYRGVTWKNDDDSVVAGWIKSLTDQNLPGIIFHDGLSDSFTRNWEGRRVGFRKVAWKSNWNATEARFVIYRSWLRRRCRRERDQDRDRRGIEHILMTDLADLGFYHNPFPLMTDDNSIYIGSEPGPIGGSCVERWMKDAYGEATDLDKPILNPGILGGQRAIVMDFLDQFVAEMERGKAGSVGLDLCAFNRVIYRNAIPYVTGKPLHTVFRGNEGHASGCCIRHK